MVCGGYGCTYLWPVFSRAKVGSGGIRSIVAAVTRFIVVTVGSGGLGISYAVVNWIIPFVFGGGGIGSVAAVGRFDRFGIEGGGIFFAA